VAGKASRRGANFERAMAFVFSDRSAAVISGNEGSRRAGWLFPATRTS